jgi:hypothetical protein
MRAFRATVLAVVMMVSALVGAGAAHAQSDAPLAGGWVTNGAMDAVAVDDAGRTYLGGSFSRVGPRTGRGVKLTSTNATPASGFPDVNGSITAVAADGAGGWFIGGDFSAVGGVTRNRLAHINADGSVDPAWNPGLSNQVFATEVDALAVSGSDVYVGGAFNSVGGRARNDIAKLSAVSGAADATWDPGANGPVLALAVSGSDVYAGGDFTSIGGQARNYVAKLSAAGSGAADAAWDPDADGRVDALAVSGTDVYLGGFFRTVGGLKRHFIAKVPATGSGAPDASWDPNSSGLVLALAVSGSDVYVGGAFSTIGGKARNNVAKLSTAGTGDAEAGWRPNPQDAVVALVLSGPDVYLACEHGCLTKVSADSGAIDATWDPNPNNEVRALAASGVDLYAGGDFTSMGGVARNNIARLNPDGSLDTTWDPGANSSVLALAVSGSDVYAGGLFTAIGGLARSAVAKLSQAGSGAADPTWNANVSSFGTVDLVAVSGNNVYLDGRWASIGGLPRTRFARVSADSGAIDSAWNPKPNDSVVALAVSGSDVYVAGLFTSVGGLARNHLAKLSAAGTGAADPTWDPNPNDRVSALAVSGTDVFVGGAFTTIGGLTRHRIAKLSAAGSGAADATWDPNPNGGVAVTALALSGSDLYVGGGFNSIGGQARNDLAKLSTEGTGEADPTWNPDASGGPGGLAVGGTRLAAIGGYRMTVNDLSTSGVALFDIAPPPPPAKPSATKAPVISGVPEPGETLSASTGTWQNDPASFDYQWLSCDSAGKNCTKVGTDSNQLALTDAQNGRSIRVTVTASNVTGSGQSVSAPTAVVGVPFATKKPTITGNLKPGKTLTASTGTWLGNPTEFHYAWSSCDSAGANCTPIGTDSTHYTLTGAESGRRIQLTVTATNTVGSGQSSRLTAAVA